jgi:uncharacterized membrane-anchored protein
MRRDRTARRTNVLLTLGIGLSFFLAAQARAQEEKSAESKKFEDAIKSINWIKGPGNAPVGEQAELKIPEGYVFTEGPGTRKMLELMQNPTSGSELGLFTPMNFEWFIIFEFSSIGFIKDAEKEKLDAEEIIDSIKKGTVESNKEREKRGWPTIEIVGWQTPPFYDKAANNLQWCIKGAVRGQPIVNYNTRLLGRQGVMSANLLVAPAKVDATLPTVKKLLEGFSFKEGKKYSEYKSGDKLAEYGLAALVVGGAAGIAAKLGLFGKLFALIGKAWKLVAAGIVALFAGIASLFKKLFGRKSPPPPSTPGAGTGTPST